MSLLTSLTRKIDSLAYMVENPVFFNLRKQGVNLEMYKSLNKPWIYELNIRTIIDIGANIGQFAWIAHTIFPDAHIYAFEPIPECFEKLSHRMREIDKFTAFNAGIGNESGYLEFGLNQFSASSSFLEILDTHKQMFPETHNTKSIKVKVEKLDDYEEKIKLIDPILIKIDVQGYEQLVIQGGKNIIKQAKAIIIETSFEPLYKGQSLFNDIYICLNKLGFTYKGIVHQLHSPDDNRILQADSIFIKEK